MKHEYKIGDRVRMLQDYGDLSEGEVYRVESVDRSDEYLPIQVSEHGCWPTVGMFELVTEEENKPWHDGKPWTGMIRAVNYTCVNADGNLETNHYIEQFDGEHWNHVPVYHDSGFGALTRIADQGPRDKDGGVLLDEITAASIASLADRIEDVIDNVWDVDTTMRDLACAIAEDFYTERKGWNK